MLLQPARDCSVARVANTKRQTFRVRAARNATGRDQTSLWRIHAASDLTGPDQSSGTGHMGSGRCPVLRQLSSLEEYKGNKWVGLFQVLFTDIFHYQAKQLHGHSMVRGNPHFPALLMGTGKLVREVLSDDELFETSSMEHGRVIGWNGLQFLKGERHALLRGKMAHAFAADEIEEYTPQVQAIAVKVVERMLHDSAASGPEGIRSLAYFKQFTFEIICRVVAGLQLSDKEMDDMREDFGLMVQGILCETLPFQILKSDLPFMPARKYWPATRRVRQRLQDVLNEAKEVVASGDTSSSSLSTVILSMADLKDHEGNPIPDEVLVDNLLLFFIAGFDTSSNVIAAVVDFIHKCPDHWKTVVDEQAALEAQHGSIMTPKILRSMAATERFVREALRMRMPVSDLTRKSSQDTVLDNHTIPAGTRVYFPLQYIARTEPIWQGETGALDPAKFNPDRFKGVAGLTNQLAFGHGRHVCLGMSLAMMEMKVFLAVLARGYSIRVLEEPSWNNAPLVHPGNGLPVKVTRL